MKILVNNSRRVNKIEKTQIGGVLLVLVILLVVLVTACKKDYKVVTPEPPLEQQVVFNSECDIIGMNDTIKDDLLSVDIVLFHSDHFCSAKRYWCLASRRSCSNWRTFVYELYNA